MPGSSRLRYRGPVAPASKSLSSLARRTAGALRAHARTIWVQRDALEKRHLALIQVVDCLQQEARAASPEQGKFRAAQAEATKMLLHTVGSEIRTLVAEAKRAEAQAKVAESRSRERPRGRPGRG